VTGCLDTRVGKDNLDRVFRVMDALLGAMDRRGYNVSIEEEKHTCFEYPAYRFGS
jgi:hypothetical protein